MVNLSDVAALPMPVGLTENQYVAAAIERADAEWQPPDGYGIMNQTPLYEEYARAAIEAIDLHRAVTAEPAPARTLDGDALLAEIDRRIAALDQYGDDLRAKWVLKELRAHILSLIEPAADPQEGTTNE